MTQTTGDAIQAADPQVAAPQAAEADAPRPVRVGWVATAETAWWLGRTLQPVALGLMDEMVELTAVCPDQCDARDLPSPPLAMVPYRERPWWSLRDTRVGDLAGPLRKQKVELLHALEGPAADLARNLARDLQVPYLVSSYSLGASAWLARAEHHARLVLAGSEPIRRDLLDHRVVSASQVRVVRPGLHQVRRATCFTDPEHHVSIVAGGMMRDFAAFEAVLRCFAELRKKKYDCAFFVVGKGPAERMLRKLADTLDLRHDLTFVDYQSASRMNGIVKSADLYISPAPTAGIDVYALLAMASGVPVIAADCGASDFIVPDQTARLFQLAQWEDLAAKVTGLLDDRQAATAQADNALAHLRDGHRPTDMAHALARIYREAVAA